MAFGTKMTSEQQALYWLIGMLRHMTVLDDEDRMLQMIVDADYSDWGRSEDPRDRKRHWMNAEDALSVLALKWRTR